MKKLIITVALICACGIGLTGCNAAAKNFGGTVQYKYTVILQNNTDFVINKKTRSTDMNLVFLVS